MHCYQPRSAQASCGFGRQGVAGDFRGGGGFASSLNREATQTRDLAGRKERDPFAQLAQILRFAQDDKAALDAISVCP